MLDLSRAALVVVDVQNDFCPGGALAVPSGDQVVPLINRLLRLKWAVTLASLDWHPRDHVSFAGNHAPPNNEAFVSTVAVTNPENADQTAEIRLWPEHCVADTPGAALVSSLDASMIQHLVRKGSDSRVEMYSCFGSVWGRVPGIEAETILREAKAADVYVVGLAGDYCVKHTALHAAQAGFAAHVVAEGTRCVAGDESATVGELHEQLRAGGVEVVAATSLLG